MDTSLFSDDDGETDFGAGTPLTLAGALALGPSFSFDDPPEADSQGAGGRSWESPAPPPLGPSFSFDDTPENGWPDGSPRSWSYPTPPSLGASSDAADADSVQAPAGPPLPPSLRPSSPGRLKGEDIARNGLAYYTTLDGSDAGNGANIGGDNSVPPDAGASSTENTHQWLYPSPDEYPSMTLGGSWLFDDPDSTMAPAPPASALSTLNPETPAASAEPPPTPPEIPGLTEAGRTAGQALAAGAGDAAYGLSSQGVARPRVNPAELKEFPEDVMAHVNRVAANLPGFLDSIGRMATLNYVGEENLYNHNRSLIGKIGHWMYDHDAAQGDWAGLESFRPSYDRLSDSIPPRAVPDSWTTAKGGIFGSIKQFLANLDQIDHDTGFANIKLRTAGVATGTDTLQGLVQVGEAITTDEGIAYVAGLIVRAAQRDLNPLLSGRSNEDKVQIITDYVRQGANHYWEENARIRGMSLAQMQQWRDHPQTFRMPDGSVPRQLEVNKWPINEFHLKQVEQALDATEHYRK